jgi:hypothetical protein
MEAKVFEVLAPNTKAAALAVKLAPLGAAEAGVAGAQGFSESYLLVSTLKPRVNQITYDKMNWLHGTGGIERPDG